MVTVAWLHSSRSCIGAPTILLRPITTALFPATDTPTEKQLKHQLIQTVVIYIVHCSLCIFTECRCCRGFLFCLPACLISSMQPFGVQGMKQSPRSPRASFPAFILVSLEKSKNKRGDIKCGTSTMPKIQKYLILTRFKRKKKKHINLIQKT